MQPTKEDVMMKEGENKSPKSKGKGQEHLAVLLNLHRVLEVIPPQKSRIPALKGPPRFEIKSKSSVENQKVPQYKYATEIMNHTHSEEVFQKILDQPITLKLGDVLGTLYELGK